LLEAETARHEAEAEARRRDDQYQNLEMERETEKEKEKTRKEAKIMNQIGKTTLSRRTAWKISIWE
jgi:hypothetical protein